MKNYGDEDTSFLAAGGAEGLYDLVESFYDYMETIPEAQKIRNMHPTDLEVTRDKLRVFLSGWLGGPREYSNKYGPIRIPAAHAHLKIEEAERDAWMLCMQKAVADQSKWADSFKEYFMIQIAVPAERVRLACLPNVES